jgi:hypothetical protein
MATEPTLDEGTFADEHCGTNGRICVALGPSAKGVFVRVVSELGCTPGMQHRVFAWFACSGAWPMGCKSPSFSWLCRNAQIERSWRARPRAAQRDGTSRVRSPSPFSPAVTSSFLSFRCEKRSSSAAAQQPAQQRRGRGGAEARRPLCRWSRGGAAGSGVGACSGRGSATADGDLKVATGGDLMAGIGGGMQKLWRCRAASPTLPPPARAPLLMAPVMGIKRPAVAA